MKGFILGILALVLLAYIAICFLMYFNQELFIFRPDKLDEDYTFSFRASQEVWLTNSSGDKIHALHMKTEAAKGVVLYFHGNSGALDRWGGVAQDFRSRGYDLFIIDYPGFGKSTGKISEQKLFSNAHICYEHLLGEYDTDRIVIYGRSIGTGVASQLASTVAAKMLILETPFYRLEDLIGPWMKVLPGKILLKYPFRNDLHIQQVDYPVWIVHGTADRVVPLSSGLKLEKYLENDHFLIIQTATHNNIAEYQEYQEWLDQVLN